MSNAILFRMPFGVAGDISRPSQATVEAQPFNSGVPFASYGIPGKLVAGLFVPLSLVGDTQPYGFLVRPYPVTGANASDPIGTAVPISGSGFTANILRRGYMTVKLNGGAASAALGGTVYVRYANPSGALVIGGLEGAAVGGSNVALNSGPGGVIFTGPADAAGNVEIAFNI